MKTNNQKNVLLAIAALSGTIIGAGFFSLPYIITQVGVWVLLAYFLVLGGLVLLIHLLLAEVALRTPDFLRLPGYAQVHLGEKGRYAALISIVFGGYGSMLAYLIIGGSFLQQIMSPVLGGGNLAYTLVYFLLGGFLLYLGIRPMAKICFFELAVFSGLLVLFAVFGKELFNANNLIGQPSLKNAFLPYGPVLFSLWGAAMIPEVEEMLGEGKKNLKKVVIISVVLAAVVYLLFALIVAGISGKATTIDGISGLIGLLGPGIVIFGLFVGIVTTFTSFVALGLTVEKVLTYDFKIPRMWALALACFAPLVMYLLGFNNFLKVISFVGAGMMGLEGVLILAMYYKIKGKKVFIYPLMVVLLGGFIYELVNFLK